MNANFIRRGIAYIIDLFLLGSLIILIYQLLPTSKLVMNLQEEIALLNENYLNQQIHTMEYMNDYSILMYQIDHEQIIQPVINFICIFLYFVLFSFFMKGQTIGKYIMKIQIQSIQKKLTFFSLFIRNLVINGLGYIILLTLVLLFLPKTIYLYVAMFLGIIQFGLVIASIFMIIYRKDKRGIQDLLSHTKVVKK